MEVASSFYDDLTTKTEIFEGFETTVQRVTGMDVLASLSKRIMGRITCEPRGLGNFKHRQELLALLAQAIGNFLS